MPRLPRFDQCSHRLLRTGSKSSESVLTPYPPGHALPPPRPQPSGTVLVRYIDANPVRARLAQVPWEYAPAVSVSLSGNGALHGALVGSTVEVSGSGGIHFDRALADWPGDCETQPERIFWFEDVDRRR